MDPLPLPDVPATLHEVRYASPPPLPRARPRVWTVFVAFVTAFLAGIVGGGLVALAMAVAIYGVGVFPGVADNSTATAPVSAPATLESALLQPAVILPMLLATHAIITAVALVAGVLSPTPLVRRLRLERPRLPWYGYGVVALGTLALGASAGIVIELLGFGDVGILQDLEEVMTGLRGMTLFAAAAVIGLGPGFAEEFLFRGYIQTRLGQRWPRLVALGVTALLFGLMHFDPVQSVMAVGLGLWPGEVADRTGSIWPAVAGHAFNNAAATVMIALAGAEAASAAESAYALAVTVPLFAVCLFYLLRRPVMPLDVGVTMMPVQIPSQYGGPPASYAQSDA